MSEEFVRVGEAARIIGVTKKTMQRWDRSGVLNPARRMPSLGCKGGRLYTRSQLNAFIKDKMGKV
jgi:DNA-binding transcriptional MerR regulator